MTIGNQVAVLRRRFAVRSATLGARRGRVDAALARLAGLGSAGDFESRRTALQQGAAIAEAHGRDEEGLEFLRNLVRLDDSSVESWTRLVARLETLGRFDEAIYGLNRILALTPGDISVLLRIAGLNDAVGDPAAQRDAWSKVLEASPSNVAALRRLAELLQGDRPAEALAYLDRLISQEPSPGLLRQRATVLDRTGDAAAAVEAWRGVLAEEGDSVDVHRRLANALEPQDAKRAVPHIRWLAQNTPSEAAARRLAVLFDRRGDAAGAIAAWRDVASYNDKALDAHRRLVELLDPIAPRDALPHLRRLTKLEGSAAAARRLAEALEGLGETEEAVSAWRTVLARDATALDAHLRLGALLEADPKASAFHLGAAARSVRTDVDLWKRLAATAARIPDNAMAAQAWETATRLAPTDLEATRAAAGALLKADRYADAIAAMRRYTRARPTEQKVRRSLVGLCRRFEDRETEIEVSRELSALNPESLEFHQALGEMLMEAGRAWEAIPYLEALATAEPEATETLARYAQALELVDRVPAAVKVWERILALRPADEAVLEHLTELLDSQDRRREVTPYFIRLAELRSQDRKAWLRLAARAREFSDVPSELIAWEHLVRLKPQDVGARRRLIELLLVVRRRPDTAPHFEVLARLSPDAEVWRSLAELREATGDGEGAIEALRRLLELDSGAAFAHERLAKLLDANNDRAGAVLHMRAVADANPDSEKAWRRLADRLESLGDLAAVVAPLEHLSALQPGDLAVKDRLASALVAVGRIEDAATLRWEVAKAFPNDLERYARLGRFLKTAGKLREAADAFRHIASHGGGDSEIHGELAELFITLGQDAEALPHLRAVARTMEGASGWRRVAQMAESLGDVERAMDAWRRVHAIEPDNYNAQDRLARLYLQTGQAQTATQVLQRLSDAKPGDATLLRRLATAQEAAEDWDGLVGTLRRLTELQPGNPPLLRRLAATLWKTGAGAEALETFRALRSSGVEDLETLRGLALAVSETGPPDAAIEAWRAVVTKAPKDIEGLRRVASLTYGHARNEALPFLRRIIALEPGDHRTRRRIAAIIAASGDVAAQVEAWRDVVQANPDDVGAHEQLADLLEVVDTDAALPHMEAVARLTSDKVKPWKRLGKWLQDLDRNAEAIAAWSQSLAIAPDDVETRRRLAQLHLLDGDYRAGLRHLDAFGRLNEEVAPALAGLVPEPPPLTATPLVSAVILSLEGAELLESLFSSFHATNTYPAVELIVVDHGSADDTARVLDAWQDKLPIRRIMRDANYSYSASCNLGVREANGELVLLLNNDVVFHEDVLGEMVRHLTPDVGIVGLKQYNSAPLPEEVLRPYHIGVRFVWDATEGWFKPKHAIPTASDTLIAQRAAYFPGVTASVMLCRKAEYLAVGGLDEAYVYGHEDMDFCCRMRMDHGLRIVSLNSHAAFHRKNSTRRADDLAVLQAQRAANEALFRERWEARIAQECLAVRFTDDGSWRGWPPIVGLGLPADAPDTAAAALLALGETLSTHLRWRVRYLLEGEPGADDGRGLDAVIADPHFPLDRVRGDGPHRLHAAIGGGEDVTPAGFDLALPTGAPGAAYAETVRDALTAAQTSAERPD